MIESYAFGKMVIDGREYTQDLMILPDGTVLDHWWLESGHVLGIRDIDPIIESAPSELIVGSGMHGMMKTEASLLDKLHRMEIEIKVLPTAAQQTLRRLFSSDLLASNISARQRRRDLKTPY